MSPLERKSTWAQQRWSSKFHRLSAHCQSFFNTFLLVGIITLPEKSVKIKKIIWGHFSYTDTWQTWIFVLVMVRNPRSTYSELKKRYFFNYYFSDFDLSLTSPTIKVVWFEGENYWTKENVCWKIPVEKGLPAWELGLGTRNILEVQLGN